MLNFLVMLATMAQENKQVKTIRDLLGLEPEAFGFSPKEESVAPLSGVALPVAPLPVIEPTAVPEPEPEKPVEFSSEVKPAPEVSIQEFGSPLSRFLTKNWVRYPSIFILALGFFYVLFNLGALWQQAGNWMSSPAKRDLASREQASPEYQKWLKKYYVFANDPQIFLANNDVDQDGLTNLQEFYLGTNPLETDTDGDGYADGQEVLNGYNPLYQGRLTLGQESVIAKDIERSTVQSRLNLVAIAGTKVSGAAIITSGMNVFPVDTSRPGNISIPKLGTDAPIIWSKEFSEMEKDLKSGTAHHPATPYPGQRGTASIHGHSSGYPWDGNYKTVFTKLNFLQAGYEVFVTMYGTTGEVRKYRFIVRSKGIYSKTDPAQFADSSGGYFLNLSTSWPVGTARERYVVTTELVGL